MAVRKERTERELWKEYVKSKTYKELVMEGEAPNVIFKAFWDVGEKYFKGVQKTFLPTRPLTPEQYEIGGDIR